MERVVRIDHDQLEASLLLTPQDRLRQADAAFRLFHLLHRPFARPFVRGFDTLEEYFEFDLESLRALRTDRDQSPDDAR
jgi:hypothetical protein